MKRFLNIFLSFILVAVFICSIGHGYVYAQDTSVTIQNLKAGISSHLGDIFYENEEPLMMADFTPVV